MEAYRVKDRSSIAVKASDKVATMAKFDYCFNLQDGKLVGAIDFDYIEPDPSAHATLQASWLSDYFDTEVSDKSKTD